MPASTDDTWAVVVPVKGGPSAKSRLELPWAVRTALADAFARDTVTAAASGMPRADLLVVTGDPLTRSWAADGGHGVVPDQGTGLNDAVAAGVAAAWERGRDRAVVLLGDHPALRPHELVAAVDLCGRHERAVVGDADGSGTALLTLPTTTRAGTAFGAGSASAHRRLGYLMVDVEAPGLRLDVDDRHSLDLALALGVGPHTARAIARATLPDVQASIHHAAEDGSARALLDDGTEVAVPAGTAAASGLLHLRVGQRVSVHLDAGGRTATRVWIVGIGPGETIR